MKNKMMIRRILIGLFLGIVVTSCTHNDGYIGPLFGKWQLIEMWENGTMTPHDSLYYNLILSLIVLEHYKDVMVQDQQQYLMHHFWLFHMPYIKHSI